MVMAITMSLLIFRIQNMQKAVFCSLAIFSRGNFDPVKKCFAPQTFLIAPHPLKGDFHPLGGGAKKSVETESVPSSDDVRRSE